MLLELCKYCKYSKHLLDVSHSLNWFIKRRRLSDFYTANSVPATENSVKWWLIADTKLNNKCFNKWLVWNAQQTFQISAMIIILEITHPIGLRGGSFQSTLQAYWSWQLIGSPNSWEVSQSVKVLSEGNLNSMMVTYNAKGKENHGLHCMELCTG